MLDKRQRKKETGRQRLEKRLGHNNKETKNERGREEKRQLETGRQREWSQALLQTWLVLHQSKAAAVAAPASRIATPLGSSLTNTHNHTNTHTLPGDEQ